MCWAVCYFSNQRPQLRDTVDVLEYLPCLCIHSVVRSCLGNRLTLRGKLTFDAAHRSTVKWAFIEAGNLVVINQKPLAGQHVVRLYQRVKRKRNHQKAIVAVARHLAEAAYWVLKKQEVYRAPQAKLKTAQTPAVSSFVDPRVSAEPA